MTTIIHIALWQLLAMLAVTAVVAGVFCAVVFSGVIGDLMISIRSASYWRQRRKEAEKERCYHLDLWREVMTQAVARLGTDAHLVTDMTATLNRIEAKINGPHK